MEMSSGGSFTNEHLGVEVGGVGYIQHIPFFDYNPGTNQISWRCRGRIIADGEPDKPL